MTTDPTTPQGGQAQPGRPGGSSHHDEAAAGDVHARIADYARTTAAAYPELGPEAVADIAALVNGERLAQPDRPGGDHDCPREAFLDDPITQHYGVGSEMLHLIACPVCEAEEAGQ